MVAIAISVIGVLGIGVVYASFMMGHMVMPAITGFLKVSENVGSGYRIPPSQDVVVKDMGGVYHATVYMAVRFYESSSAEAEAPMSSTYLDLWERGLAGVKFPFKFCLITYLEDLAKYRESVEDKRFAATYQLGKAREVDRPDALTIDKWEREIARMNSMLERLAEGEKPMGAVQYAVTTGIGVNEGAAIAAAKRQVGEIRATVANALNVEIKPLKGEDMKRCFVWEQYVPSERAEFLAGL
ncbi:Uncharacterised protein [uncultured archaeon]|nr:Uncharacterised protein [uncultured archaeon]